MKNRRPIKLEKTLILWNGALAIFSIFGFFRIGQEVLYLIKTSGYYGTVCLRLFKAFLKIL